MSSILEEPTSSFIYEKDFFNKLKTVHQASVLIYRRSDEIKAICNPCVPELSSVRSASEIRQVARLLAKSAGGLHHPKFSMIVAEVDHTIIKFMEVIHKYYESESKMSAMLPLLLLMPPTVDRDLKQFVRTCEDVHHVVEGPFSCKDVFGTIVAMIHRRHVADDLFTSLNKSHSKHLSEAKGVEIHEHSASIMEASSSIAEEIDEEDLAIDVQLSDAEVNVTQYLESSKLILPKDVCRVREYYMKELKRNNIFETLSKYTINSVERSRIDDLILKNLHKGIAYSILHSDEKYET